VCRGSGSVLTLQGNQGRKVSLAAGQAHPCSEAAAGAAGAASRAACLGGRGRGGAQQHRAAIQVSVNDAGVVQVVQGGGDLLQAESRARAPWQEECNIQVRRGLRACMQSNLLWMPVLASGSARQGTAAGLPAGPTWAVSRMLRRLGPGPWGLPPWRSQPS
jgi:hypothetical protein